MFLPWLFAFSRAGSLGLDVLVSQMAADALVDDRVCFQTVVAPWFVV
jgi:hypothetical protein